MLAGGVVLVAGLRILAVKVNPGSDRRTMKNEHFKLS